MTVTDDYTPSTALSSYFPSVSGRSQARLWSIEKLVHDAAAAGLLQFFEGPGPDPTGLPGYSTSKIWLKQSAGVQLASGTVHFYDGSGSESDPNSWPALTPEKYFRHLSGLGSITPGTLGSDYPSRTALAVANVPAPQLYARTAGFNSAGDGGGALYKRVESEPSHPGKVQSADGSWWEINEPVLLLPMLGAVGDGSVDDTDAILGALAIGGVIDGLGRTYRVTRHLGEMISNTTIRNAVIDCTDVVGGTSSLTESLLTATGTVGTAYALAADSTTATGSNPYISLSSSGDAANFSSGDLVRLQSSEIWSTGITVGELAVVQRVDGEKVYLQCPLTYNYATVDSATIQKILPVENIRFKNVVAIGPTSLTLEDAAEKLGFFAGLYTRNVRFVGGRLEGFNRSGIEVRWSYNVWVEKNDLKNFIEFYAVAIYSGSRNVWVDKNTFLNTRHAVTISASNTFGGGIVNDVWITDNVSSGRDASFDAHPAADNVHFTGNKMHAEGSVSSPLGLMFNGRNLTATDNQFYGYGSGIIYQPLYFGGYRATVNISGNDLTFNNPSSNVFTGIYAQVGTTFSVVRLDALTIANNNLKGNISIGIYTLISGGAEDLEAVAINGNVVNGATTCVQCRSNGTGALRGFSIAGNVFANFTTGVLLRADNASATIEGFCIAGNTFLDGTTGITRAGSATFRHITIGPNSYANVTTAVPVSFNASTIASGAITLVCPSGPAVVDTESAAASDDLDTINGGDQIGQQIVLQSFNSGRDVTVKHGTGNIRLAGGADFALASTNYSITLRWSGTHWLEVSRASVS